MKHRIFLLHEGEKLTSMEERAYDSEDRLQALLANYPDLLGGDQMDEASPRRWLLVEREVTVPGDASGAGRWYLDHLFIDQDGVPTLADVKRILRKYHYLPDRRVQAAQTILEQAELLCVDWGGSGGLY